VSDTPPDDKKAEDAKDVSTKDDEKKLPPSKLGRFIQTYSAFLSSFVIGMAGLIATSIWQYRQSEIARRQSESQQEIAKMQAENSWRIERAEILAKNLQVLASHGANTADQRYGVLLSLTRGNILDPELAVSYALELGKDNADYMRSVLASAEHKSYQQLLQAFQMTCLQRYGVARDVPVCKNDLLAERSQAIAELIADELDDDRAAVQSGGKARDGGPMTLLADERRVQGSPAKLAWLFEPYLTSLYERRQWSAINDFERRSTGARLVAALVLMTSRTGELVAASEAAALEKLHAERRAWLANYLLGSTCDAECRGKLADTMLSVYGEAQGSFDDVMRRLLMRPRSEAAPALARLHSRLLWCQVDAGDLALFRDRVLVPTVAELATAKKPPDAQIVEDVVSLLAMAPEPTAEPARTAFRAAIAALQKNAPQAYQKAYLGRRAYAERERLDPPALIRKMSFCGAEDTSFGVAPPTED
jgi:hypothetical protein